MELFYYLGVRDNKKSLCTFGAYVTPLPILRKQIAIQLVTNTGWPKLNYKLIPCWLPIVIR